MNYLFTVQYALNYEGWTLDPNVYPEYNSYILDEFTIKVRRNDFFLMLFITNSCGKLVFSNRIYTIYQYKRLIKRKLHLWKCNNSSSINPTPPVNSLQIVPKIINLTYTEGGTILDTKVADLFNELATVVTPMTIPNINITVTITEVYVSGFALTAGNYTQVILFRGITTGVIISLVFNITILSPISYILLENNDKILTENNNFIIIE